MHSRVQAGHLAPMWVRPEFPGATVAGQEQVTSVMPFSHPSAFPHPSSSSFPSSLSAQSNVMRAILDIAVSSLEGPDRVRGTSHTARPVHNRIPSIHKFMPQEAARATSCQLCSGNHLLAYAVAFPPLKRAE